MLALLGTVTFWSPSASIVLLYLAAMPLAALAAWLAAARVTGSGWLRVVAAAGWTLAPSFLVALDEGRLGAVVAHLLLPWLFFALTAARRSWAAAAAAALLAAGVLAGAPSLWPALLLVWVVSVVVFASSGRRGRGWHRLLLLPLPAIALFAPLAAQQILRGTPLGILADPGVVVPVDTDSSPLATALGYLVGLPTPGSTGWEEFASPLGASAGIVGAALLLPVVLVALASALLPGISRATPALALAAVGFGSAVLLSRVAVQSAGSTALGPWPGPLLSLAWLGLLGAAVIGLSAGERRVAAARLRAGVGGLVALGVAAAAFPLLLGFATGEAGAAPGSERTLPALVAAEASGDPTIGTLVLSAQRGNGLAASVARGTGQTLDEQSTLFSTAPASLALGRDLTALAGNVASRSGYDPVPVLAAERIGFLLLTPTASDTHAVHDRAAAALDGNPLFTPVTTTSHGTLWRYTGLDAGLPVAAPSGPGALDTPTGIAVLTVQLVVLLLTLLLALPTGGLADRIRPEREARRGSGIAPRRAAAAAAPRAVLATAGTASMAPQGGAARGQ
ncbi:hypothetical protein GCM10025866_18890 [Naasia aerilata]|uniref:Uncharacterized protein n=1 Tax=Naasia aerilata TaxID=1162966 RepID=A0ABN6XQR9_9MICO|nr:hypothetical protein GCM10025866_18890 [Naasia aerilata]